MDDSTREEKADFVIGGAHPTPAEDDLPASSAALPKHVLPAGAPFSAADLATAVAVLRAAAADEGLLGHASLRELRTAIQPVIKRQRDRMYEGKASAAHYQSDKSKSLREKAQRTLDRRNDQIYVNKTRLRGELAAPYCAWPCGARRAQHSLPLSLLRSVTHKQAARSSGRARTGT